MSKKVIVIPTYNEMGNIEITLSKIQNLNQKFDVVVVDGTCVVVKGAGVVVDSDGEGAR